MPDDDRGALIDRWYYGKHTITLMDPEWTYKFRPNNGELARNFTDNLEEWFARLWKRTERASSYTECSTTSDGQDDEVSVGTLANEDEEDVVEKDRIPPEVSVKSIRRNGRRMAGFVDGLWEIQEAIGDMRVWKTWTPPSSLET